MLARVLGAEELDALVTIGGCPIEYHSIGLGEDLITVIGGELLGRCTIVVAPLGLGDDGSEVYRALRDPSVGSDSRLSAEDTELAVRAVLSATLNEE